MVSTALTRLLVVVGSTMVWYALPGVSGRIACACESVGDVTISGPVASANATRNSTISSHAPSFVGTTQALVMSTSNVTRAATETLFGTVAATFACKCNAPNDGEGETVQYLVSATAPRGCLDDAAMGRVCVELDALGLMKCTSKWASGAAGPASIAGVETGALMRAVDLAFGADRNISADCKHATAFTGVGDTVVDGSATGTGFLLPTPSSSRAYRRFDPSGVMSTTREDAYHANARTHTRKRRAPFFESGRART